MVVVAVVVVGVKKAGAGWTLYKVVRTPNSHYQWDFLAESQIHSIIAIKIICTDVHQGRFLFLV